MNFRRIFVHFFISTEFNFQINIFYIKQYIFFFNTKSESFLFSGIIMEFNLNSTI